MSDDEKATLEAVESELKQLRALLSQPDTAEQMTAAIISKLATKSTARDRLQAAKVASVMLEVGDPLRAGSLFQQLLELDPDEPYYRTGRGQAHLRAGETRAAIIRFDQAIAMDAGQAEAYLGRGEARLALALTREAREDFEKVVALDPQSTFALLAMRHLGSGTLPV
jgi:tetratricopeptide (TPR) repeat protein